MGVTNILRVPEIQQPAATPLGGGLLNHLSITREQKHLMSRDDNALWRSYRELKIIPKAFDPCDDTDGPTLGGYKWAIGTTFALEIGAECSILGLDVAEQRTKVRAQFDAYEGTAIEYALEAVFTAKATSITPTATAVPGGLTHVQALAALEDRAARDYPYKPIIHMSRYLLSLLGDRVVWKGDAAFTRSGIPIAAGGGYGSADVAEWKDPTMFLTGQMYIESSPEYGVDQIIDRRMTAPTELDEGTATSAITTYRRAYRVGFEGPVLSINAKGI